MWPAVPGIKMCGIDSSQSLPRGSPPTAITGTAGNTTTENQKTVSRKELRQTATTGTSGDNRSKRSQQAKGDGDPVQFTT